MKQLLFVLSTFIIMSCQSGTEQTAQKAIDRYVVFVDSVNKAKVDKRAQRWQFITEEHARKRNDAEAALGVFQGDKFTRESKRVRESHDKFKGIKVQVEQ